MPIMSDDVALNVPTQRTVTGEVPIFDTGMMHNFDEATQRLLLTGFALNGLCAASGLNVPNDSIAQKAVQLADHALRELARPKR